MALILQFVKQVLYSKASVYQLNDSINLTFPYIIKRQPKVSWLSGKNFSDVFEVYRIELRRVHNFGLFAKNIKRYTKGKANCQE